MVDIITITRLTEAFPKSFVNNNGEFIAHARANEYFNLKDCETEFDVKCKVLEWLSRGAFKTCPFNRNVANEKFHNFMLNGINDYLCTDFTESDIEVIYQHLGNRVRHCLTVEFVKSGYDMALFGERGDKQYRMF